MTNSFFARAAGTAALVLVAAACGKKDAAPVDSVATATPEPAPVVTATVSNIELGRHIGPNRRVTETTDVFSPRDTFYVAVTTDNTTATSNLTARWTHEGGQVVDSTSQAVARSDAAGTVAVTEFHVAKRSGWPLGKYKVEIMLDGVAAGTRDFEVKRK